MKIWWGLWHSSWYVTLLESRKKCNLKSDCLFVVIIVLSSSGQVFVFLCHLAISFIWLRTPTQLGKNCEGVKTMQHKRSPISINQSNLSSLTAKRHKTSTSLSSKVSPPPSLVYLASCIQGYLQKILKILFVNMRIEN